MVIVPVPFAQVKVRVPLVRLEPLPLGAAAMTLSRSDEAKVTLLLLRFWVKLRLVDLAILVSSKSEINK